MTDEHEQNILVDLTAPQAWKLLQNDPRAVLVDIRSSMEFLFVGHPVGAINIPWIDEPDWVVNPHFSAEVRRLVLGGVICNEQSECAPVILICRSGNRTREAAEVLLAAGMKQVFHVADGFEGKLDEHHHRSSLDGWRYHDLPWEQC